MFLLSQSIGVCGRLEAGAGYPETSTSHKASALGEVKNEIYSYATGENPPQGKIKRQRLICREF